MRKFIILLQLSALIFNYIYNGVEAVDCDIDPKNNEGRLRHRLFCEYDKVNRPVLNDGPITIRFKMIIKGFTFNDGDGKITVSSWLAMSWTDEHLKWDPKDFQNLQTITHSSQNLWQPDLALYNSDISSTQDDFCKDANCVITNNGLVSCIPPCSHTAKCTPNYTRWPFDRQNCTLHIGTWVNSGEEIDFKVVKTVITEENLSSQNLEWKLLEATYKRRAGNYSSVSQTYPSLIFTFSMERHSATHAAVILAPALTLVILNLISLWVDSENNRRIILLSLSLYVHILYLQHLFWTVPHNGDTLPDLLLFFRDSLLITIILIVNTICIHGMKSRTIQMPDWAEKTTVFMRSNRFGQFFLTKHLVPSEKFGSLNGLNDDDINLVESQATEPKDIQEISKRKWQTFGNIIDRTLFVSLSVIYLYMIIRFLPEDFLDNKDLQVVEITGY